MDSNQSQPISQNIPPEVLGHIFTLICANYVYVPPSADGYPWILGHICSYWRQVLWGTHSIWKKIATTFVGRESSRVARKKVIAEMLIYILEKIDSPISLTIQEPVDFYLDIIVGQPERFTTLYLSELSETAMLRLLELPHNAFPILEHFTFAVSSTGHLIFDRATSPLQNAPMLRSITCNPNAHCKEMRGNLYTPLTAPVWSKLEEITLWGAIALSFTEIYDIWKGSPNLKSCRLEIKYGEEIPTMQVITLPTVQRLHLKTHSILDWDKILSSIMAPSLEYLNIQAPDMPVPPLISLMSRSRCLLKVLDIYGGSPFEGIAGFGEIAGSLAHNMFHHIALVTAFIVTWTLSTSAIQSISDGALPNLLLANFCVSPEAFSALLDMIDLYIDQSRNLPCFDIKCHPGPGLNEVRTRYLARYRLYQVRGVKMIVTNSETLERIVAEEL